MLFLTKSSSTRHSLFVLMLAFCCLTSALGAKIIKKVAKPGQNNNEDKDATVAEESEAAATSNEVNDDDNDDDDDDDDDEDEEETVAEVNKEAAAVAAAEATTTADKNPNAVQTADPTDLSVWGMVRSLWSWLRSDISESLFGGDDDDDDVKKPATVSAVEGRTFGKIRRLQMALIPIIFKFGVLSAMVAFLVAIGMKSLFLLKILVVMNAIAILGKFITLKSSLFGQYENTAPSFNYPGWNPHAKESSWGTTGLSGSGAHPPSKEIHLHIHGNAQTQAQLAGGYNYETQSVGSGGWASRSDPYGAYAPTTAGQYLDSAPVNNVNALGELPNNTDPMSLLPTKYPARNLIR